jgi:hypothetical protein
MRFVKAQSALASYWAIARSALGSRLPVLGLASQKAIEGATDEAVTEYHEPEQLFLGPYVPSKADLHAQVLLRCPCNASRPAVVLCFGDIASGRTEA